MTPDVGRTRSEYLRPTWSPVARGRDAPTRPVDDADRGPLAALLLEAYRGTIDDEGEGPAEALAAIDLSLAIIDRRASVIIEDDGVLIAISFVVDVGGRRYIDPVATSATRKRDGLGRAAVAESLTRLHDLGIDEVGAVITDGNVASERLFSSLGFMRIGEWPRRPPG